MVFQKVLGQSEQISRLIGQLFKVREPPMIVRGCRCKHG
uniref:Uncharacterized protein n=1 Tax=Anguilla anguilla TaxID=7936 RepID=A0A0E9WMW3_ANGAN